MNCIVCQNCEVASDYPACSACAKAKHFEHVRGGCRHCAAMAEAEMQAEPMLRLVAPAYAAEIKRAYSDDAPLRADMLGELWLNESELDLESVGRYADPQCACEGIGASQDCESEWKLCDCIKAALLAAKPEPEFISVVRLLTPKPGYGNAREFFAPTQERRAV